jgi:hypothetical protein
MKRSEFQIFANLSVDEAMTYINVADSGFGFFDPAALKEKGRELNAQYLSADPFPHIVIDNFCSPEMLELCLEHFPAAPDPDSKVYARDQERFKTSYNPDYLPGQLRSFFYSMNSRPFVRFLENLTGIKGLIPDPFFLGGGFHQTTQGGHLSVHADFNYHKPLGIERRLNILIYLNHYWKEEYGGALELWDAAMGQCVKKVAPVFNRCVIFSTSGKSHHGHPDPINHPENKPRRSIALYYYTATWDPSSVKRTTQFKRRPQTGDATDWRVKIEQVAEDFLPPIIWRNIQRLVRQ